MWNFGSPCFLGQNSHFYSYIWPKFTSLFLKVPKRLLFSPPCLADFILWVLHNRKKKREGEFCKLTNTGSSCSGDNTICYQLSSTTITAAGQTGNKSLWIPVVRGCNFAISLLGGFSVVPSPLPEKLFTILQFNGCNVCNNILFTFLSWGITKNWCNFIF